jgi:peroxiredoxin
MQLIMRFFRGSILLLVILGLSLSSSAQTKVNGLKAGNWVGIIQLDDASHVSDMPFNFKYIVSGTGKSTVEITNAGEKIVVKDVIVKGDSLKMKFPIFQSEILAAIKNDKLTGTYYPKGKSEGNGYNFTATYGVTDRFAGFKDKADINVSGHWEFIEAPGTPDASKDLAEFFQTGDRVTGSILTTSGDYRYLDGKVSGNKFMVSTLDGAHSLLITGDINSKGELVNGKFVGSRKWKTDWSAVRTKTFELPAADKLVTVKDPSIKFNFAFPDMDGKIVRLSDDRFRNKVVIITATGSWCPNCLDEIRYLKDIYNKDKAKGLEIISLCFESKDYEKSKQRIIRFRDDIGAKFTFLYAGEAGSKDRSAAFPMLQGPMAFPSAVFIDRLGVIRKVHTGFSGPGTGEYYKQFAIETQKFIDQLLAEK